MTLLLPLAIPLLLGLAFRLHKKRRARELHRRLRPGHRVVTHGGLHGVIAHLDESVVGLEATPGVVQVYDRAAIARVLSLG
ncbi:preprotein translocase subunit YajC [Nocardia macrotermitis]|uniref:preprotein translocase subunit YajC n=1 Tax=Nocardia macrotermitis TaxID=2585198 RepID=UPI001885DBEC|nr:preprotein translocase subunit YajC [Nocardia macrotermitis]